MTGRRWRLTLLVALLLLTSVGAEAQRRSSVRDIKKGYPAAAAEIVRTNPEVAKKLRELFPTESFELNKTTSAERAADTLRQQLQAQKFTLKLQKQGEQQVLKLEPLKRRNLLISKEAIEADSEVNTEIARTFVAISRREQILKDMGAKVVKTFGGLHDNQTQSDLAAYLKGIRVTGYQDVANSFDAKSVTQLITLPKEVTLLRIFGGGSKPSGRYMFCCLAVPEGAPPEIQARSGPSSRWTDASGLATHPNNLLSDLAAVKVPAGTRLFIGTVKDNFEDASGLLKPGGNTQLFLPAENNFPYEHYRRTEDAPEASDIVVRFDNDKILHFQRSPT